jgi:hypothetical protein
MFDEPVSSISESSCVASSSTSISLAALLDSTLDSVQPTLACGLTRQPQIEAGGERRHAPCRSTRRPYNAAGRQTEPCQVRGRRSALPVQCGQPLA